MIEITRCAVVKEMTRSIFKNMTQKYLYIGAVLVTLPLATIKAQTGDLQTIVKDAGGYQQIEVPDGSLFEVITFTSEGRDTGYYGGRAILSVTKDGKTAKFAFSKFGNGSDARETAGNIAGPATITLQTQGESMLTYPNAS